MFSYAVIQKCVVHQIRNSLDIESLKRRDRAISKLKEKGEMVDQNSFVFKQVYEIVDRLNLPDSIELVVMDSEDFMAYVDISVDMLVISRGVLRHFVRSLKNFSADHLAALLAHEAEHAVEKDNLKKKVEKGSNQIEKLMSTYDPAEEMRADAKGMKRMSKAGYNPRAMIDILRTFNLRFGRTGLSHQIE